VVATSGTPFMLGKLAASGCVVHLPCMRVGKLAKQSFVKIKHIGQESHEQQGGKPALKQGFTRNSLSNRPG
jgi:hypothetical protein